MSNTTEQYDSSSANPLSHNNNDIYWKLEKYYELSENYLSETCKNYIEKAYNDYFLYELWNAFMKKENFKIAIEDFTSKNNMSSEGSLFETWRSSILSSLKCIDTEDIKFDADSPEFYFVDLLSYHSLMILYEYNIKFGYQNYNSIRYIPTFTKFISDNLVEWESQSNKNYALPYLPDEKFKEIFERLMSLPSIKKESNSIIPNIKQGISEINMETIDKDSFKNNTGKRSIENVIKKSKIPTNNIKNQYGYQPKKTMRKHKNLYKKINLGEIDDIKLYNLENTVETESERQKREVDNLKFNIIETIQKENLNYNNNARSGITGTSEQGNVFAILIGSVITICIALGGFIWYKKQSTEVKKEIQVEDKSDLEVVIYPGHK